MGETGTLRLLERHQEMTKEQNIKLHEIGKVLQALLPDFHGSIKFNLQPPRKAVFINVEESVILQDPNK